MPLKLNPLTGQFDITYSLPDTAVTPGSYTNASLTVDQKGRLTAASSGAAPAPSTASFVTLGTDATLTSERVLTGTSNQVTVTDNGAGSTVVLSLPQNIHTAATPTFSNLTLSARTSTRVAYFGIGGTLTDDADFTFNGSQLQLATTGTSGGLLIGGDTQLYRVSAAVMGARNTQFQVVPSTFTATSGSMRSLYSEAIFNPSGATSGRAWGYVFYAEARSANNFTDATSCIVGVEGTVVNNSTGTLSAMSCGIFFNSLAANSTTTRFAGLDVYGADVSGSAGTGATVTEAAGLVLRMGRSSGNTSLGNITSFYGVQNRASTWSGTGHMTNQYGMAYATGATMNSVTANNQVRKYVEVPAMPTLGAFTGTTVYGIDFLGTSRAVRDGIRIAGDCELYSFAANTLSTGTGDSFRSDTSLLTPLLASHVSGTDLTVRGFDNALSTGTNVLVRGGNGSGAKGGAGGSVAIRGGTGTTPGSVSIYKVDGATRVIQVDETGLGFFAVAPVAQQASGANLTNNVTSGGTDDTIANYTDLVIYANDAAAIRNDIYQLARKLKQVNDALRTYGLLT